MFAKYIILICMIMLCMCFSGCGKEADKEDQEKNTQSGTTAQAGIKDTEKDQGSEKASEKEALIHIHNSDELTKYILNSKKPCLVDFYSDQCPPCRMLAPIVKKLAEEYKGKAVICKVSLDISENRELGATYNIRAIPAVILFSNGKEVKRLVGLNPEETYRICVDKMIEKTDED